MAANFPEWCVDLGVYRAQGADAKLAVGRSSGEWKGPGSGHVGLGQDLDSLTVDLS